MSSTVEYDEALGIIILTYRGDCSGQDFRDASLKRIALAAQKRSTRTLIDTTDLECSLSSTLDVFDIVEHEYPQEANVVDWKIAIKTPKSVEAREQVDFYENVCVNRGMRVKKFEQRQDAID